MKSGLWILVVVLAVAVVTGMLLKPRLNRLMEDQEPPEVAELDEIEKIEDPEARLSRLGDFLSEYPASKVRDRAYGLVAGTMVRTLKDTTGFLEFADKVLDEDEDPESRTVTYRWLYAIQAITDTAAALATAERLLGESMETSGIYNYVGFDLAERGIGLDIALGLCNRALEFAESGSDSAHIMDSRGWVYYRMGEYDRAVADLEVADALFDPPYEEVLRHLAYAALKAGQTDKAFQTLKSILVMGEYDYVRAALDSLMDARGYSPSEKGGLEEAVWEERTAGARAGAAFTLKTLTGEAYEFDPQAGRVAVINFMSPT
jgi:tetratricopeptide (TPR) repeat protein